MIIAIDFDGTLCKDLYPEIGRPNRRLIRILKDRATVFGDKLILWTCRTGKRLDDAVEWCKNFGLHFDAVNENLPEIKKEWGEDTRKVYADKYIDDKSTFIPW